MRFLIGLSYMAVFLCGKYYDQLPGLGFYLDKEAIFLILIFVVLIMQRRTRW